MDGRRLALCSVSESVHTHVVCFNPPPPAVQIVDGISYGLNLWAEEAKQDKSVRTQLWIDTLSPAVSTVALVGITIYVMIDAVDRLKEHDSDEEVNARVMWIFAAINLVLDFGNIALCVVAAPGAQCWVGLQRHLGLSSSS